MAASATNRITCPTCAGKKVIPGICEVSPEWEGIKTPEQEACSTQSLCPGQICTPETVCPTCGGKGFVKS